MESVERMQSAPEKIRSMFDAIAPTYDILNHLLSFGLDIRWRRKAVALLASKRGGRILDLAAGSGDVSLELLSIEPAGIVAADFAGNMLEVFREKLKKRGVNGVIELLRCDAMSLPLEERSFDAVIVAFGIRNFADRLVALREMHRVLKPGGVALILELSRPTAPVIAQCYDLYARVGLPMLGKVISRHNAAYSYLPASIARFPEPGEFLDLMRQAGLAGL